MTPTRATPPLLRRLRLVHGGDEGIALPTVLALMVVAAILVTSVTAVSLNAVGSTTSTRASVQAQAAAEAGLDVVRGTVATAVASNTANTLVCTYETSTTPQYKVQVQYGSGIVSAPSNCATPVGAVGSVTANSVLIVSTGTASTKGIQSNSSGDTRRVQGVMTAGTTSTPTSTPTTSTSTTTTTVPGFDRAVFVGSGGTTSSGNWTLNNASGSAGGLYVNGKLTCGGSINVGGPALVWGDAALNGGSGGCLFRQGLTVTGDVTACTSTTVTGVLSVKGAAALSSNCRTTDDLVANGPVTCNGTTVGGRLVSTTGSLNLQSGCRVAGATYAASTASCNGATMSGTFSAQGAASFTGGCTTAGDAYVGGALTCNGTFSSSVYVQGAVSATSDCNVGSSLRATGNLGGYRLLVGGAMVSAGGTLSAAQGTAGSVTVKTAPSSTSDYGGMTIGGRSCNWQSPPACTWTVSSTSAAPPAPPTSPVTTAPNQPVAAQAMPVVTASTFGTPSTTWAQLVRDRYLAHGATSTAPSRFSTASETCTLTAPATVSQAGSSDSLNGPIDAPASVSVVDARGCSTLQLRAANIVLNGDLTLLVSSFTTTNGLTVTKGSSVASGVTPTLRIVTPMADGTSTCAANTSAGTITANSGGTSLGSDVSLLLYSAGVISISNGLSFYGQMYSCTISELKNDVTVNFRSLAPTSSSTSTTSTSTSTSTPTTTPTTGTSSGGPSTTWVVDVRDVSRA